MLEWLRAADHWLFHKLNGVWTHPWLDTVLPVLTDLHQVRPVLYGALPVALLWWLHAKRGQAVRAVAGVALAVALTDAVSHRLIKPFFARSRPPKAGVEVTLRSRPHSGYSFPSNHAGNTAAAAVVLRSAAPGLSWAAVLLAVAVAYSRVYVGVHFPADVLGGAALGGLIGWGVVLLLRHLKLLKK